jgi:hypothetical protein
LRRKLKGFQLFAPSRCLFSLSLCLEQLGSLTLPCFALDFAGVRSGGLCLSGLPGGGSHALGLGNGQRFLLGF